MRRNLSCLVNRYLVTVPLMVSGKIHLYGFATLQQVKKLYLRRRLAESSFVELVGEFQEALFAVGRLESPRITAGGTSLTSLKVARSAAVRRRN